MPHHHFMWNFIFLFLCSFFCFYTLLLKFLGFRLQKSKIVIFLLFIYYYYKYLYYLLYTLFRLFSDICIKEVITLKFAIFLLFFRFFSNFSKLVLHWKQWCEYLVLNIYIFKYSDKF